MSMAAQGLPASVMGALAPSIYPIQTSGGLRALAMVAAITTAATLAMTMTTAAGLRWPLAAFQLLGLALIAAILIAHLAQARAFAPARLAFMAGVVVASVPSLAAAAAHRLTHWDDFMTWLPNATYILKLGMFPTAAALPVASDLPGYPPGSSIVLAAVWALAGRVVDVAGPLLNVLCLMVLPGIALRTLRLGSLSHLQLFGLGVALGLLATVLNVAVDWHWVLSLLPEVATLVAFAAAFTLGDECLFRRTVGEGGRLMALAMLFAFIANLKQTGIALVGILVVAAAVTTLVCRPDDRRSLRDAARTVALVLFPSMAVWLCWHVYLAEVFTAHAVSFRPLPQWYFSLLPDLARAIGSTAAEHWVFFVPLALIVARGWFVLALGWRRPGRLPSAGDRLAAVFAIVETAYVGMLVVCYIGSFNEGEVRGAAEFSRYQAEVGGAALVVALVLVAERLREARFVALMPAALALQLAAVAIIWPAAGVFEYAGVLAADQIETLRQLGREAGVSIRAERNTNVVMFTDGLHPLEMRVMRYQMWATAPDLIASVTELLPRDERTPVAMLVRAAQQPTPSVMLINASPPCGLYAARDGPELLPTSQASPVCRSLLAHFDRGATERDALQREQYILRQ